MRTNGRGQFIIKSLSFTMAILLFLALTVNHITIIAQDSDDFIGNNWVALSEEEMKSVKDIASFDFSVGGESYKGSFRFGALDTLSPNSASLNQLTYYISKPDGTFYTYLFHRGSSSFVNLYEHEMGNSNFTDISSIKNLTVYVRKDYPSEGLVSVKASGISRVTRGYNIELTLIPNKYGTVTFETTLTPRNVEKEMTRNFIWRLDTQLYESKSNRDNDSVPVYSLGKNKGLYIEDKQVTAMKVAFPNVPLSLDGPDAYQAGVYSQASLAFDGIKSNFTGSGHNAYDLGEAVFNSPESEYIQDSGVFFLWRNRQISTEKPLILRYQVGLASAGDENTPPDFGFNPESGPLIEGDNFNIAGTWFDQDSATISLWIKNQTTDGIKLGELSGAAMQENQFDYSIPFEMLADLNLKAGENKLSFYVVDESGLKSDLADYTIYLHMLPQFKLKEVDKGINLEEGKPLILTGTTNQTRYENFDYYIKVESKPPILINDYMEISNEGVFTAEIPYRLMTPIAESDGTSFLLGAYAKNIEIHKTSDVNVFLLEIIKEANPPTI